MAHQTQEDIQQLWWHFINHSLIQQIITECSQSGHSYTVFRDGDRAVNKTNISAFIKLSWGQAQYVTQIKDGYTYCLWESWSSHSDTIIQISPLERLQHCVTADLETDAWLLSQNYLEHRSSWEKEEQTSTLRATEQGWSLALTFLRWQGIERDRE